jgi:hypothetical protein
MCHEACLVSWDSHVFSLKFKHTLFAFGNCFLSHTHMIFLFHQLSELHTRFCFSISFKKLYIFPLSLWSFRSFRSSLSFSNGFCVYQSFVYLKTLRICLISFFLIFYPKSIFETILKKKQLKKNCLVNLVLKSVLEMEN